MSPVLIRILVLALVFGSVMLGIEAASNWLRHQAGTGRAINRRLKMIASGQDRGTVLSQLRRDDETLGFTSATPMGRIALSMIRTLHGAGLSIAARTLFLALFAGAIAIFVIVVAAAVFVGYPATLGLIVMAAAFALALGIGIPMLFLSRLCHRRRKRMEEQFPVALDTFVRGLRAGHPIAAALELLTQEMQDPIGSEFGIVTDEVTYGADLRDALQRMADRWNLNEINMFVVCLSVQSETGGNLAEILENLSKVIRERASLFLKVRALSSEGRMTGVILTALPILAFVGLFLLNPSFYLDVAGDRAFVIGFSALILLYLTGFITIRRMIDLKV